MASEAKKVGILLQLHNARMLLWVHGLTSETENNSIKTRWQRLVQKRLDAEKAEENR